MRLIVKFKVDIDRSGPRISFDRVFDRELWRVRALLLRVFDSARLDV